MDIVNCLYRLLETLDVSFNYFASEDSLAPIITLPRLVTLMLYGNPVLGPTGEDPMFIYIEKLVEKAGELRDASGSTLKDVDVSDIIIIFAGVCLMWLCLLVPNRNTTQADTEEGSSSGQTGTVS